MNETPPTGGSVEPRLRVGLIGPGSVADRFLIPALNTLPNAVFWSVVSRDKSRAEDFARRHGAKSPTPAHTTIADLLADKELDAVIIATPDGLHAEHAIAAARAGKHVFVEKPMATSVAACQQMIAECKKAGVALAVGYHLRFHAGHRLLLEKIKAGELGDLKHIELTWTLKADPSDWRNQKDSGRWWSLGATGTHGIDFVRWLTGSTPRTLTSEITTAELGNGHDETARIKLSFDGDVTAEVLSSVKLVAPRTIKIEGTKGTALCDGTLGPWGKGTITIDDVPLQFTPSCPYAAELADFVRAAVEGSTPESDGRNGLTNVWLLEAATGPAGESNPD